MKKYDDLIELPYRKWGTNPKTGVDCLWVARTVLSRMIEDFPASALPIRQNEIDAAINSAMAGRCGWKQVSWPDRAGDVVFGLLEDENAYVAVLIDPVGRNVITAVPDRGVCLIPYRKLKGVVGTVRWVGL